MYQPQQQNSPGESGARPAAAPARFSRMGMIAVCLLFTGCAVAPPTAANSKPAPGPQFKAGASHFGGIGLELTTNNGPLTVVSALKDSPADRAGILPGDIIFEIDGAATQPMTLLEAVNRARGEPGTTVKLKMLRPSTQETKEYTLTRVHIRYGSPPPGQSDSSKPPATLPPPTESATPF
jgi:predicted metalloprotease with PDZ domain